MTPPNYVEVQRSCNTAHSDGAIEKDGDSDVALDLVGWLEEGGGAFDSVLVVGCRSGYEIDAFRGAFSGAAVLGVDLVPEFVRYANSRGRCALVADMHALPFGDRLFDLVYCCATLEHAHDAHLAVGEMLRVANRAVFCTADLGTDSSKRNPSHFTFLDEPEWLALFDRPGWTVEHKIVEESVHLFARRHSWNTSIPKWS